MWVITGAAPVASPARGEQRATAVPAPPPHGQREEDETEQQQEHEKGNK